MVIDFARNINKFAVNKYTQVVPVKKVAGYYLEMTIEEAGRILATDLSDKVWHDGQEAPEGAEGSEKFEYKAYETLRFAFPFVLGDLTIDQASWNILAQHSSIKARQAMTARTQQAITVLTTSGNYASDHQSVVASISGNSGTWAASTTARQDIKRSLHHAAEKILDDTLAAIELDDLMVVLSSGMAAKLSQCQEIVDYVKGSPDALAQIRGELPGENAIYGLPDKLYGFPIVVEKTRKVTSRKGATRAASSILGDTTSFMVSRPGGLVGVADSPNFSTCVNFALEEMTVETLRDAPSRRTLGRVVDNYVYKMVAPVSGFLFTTTS
jgi:hypothetical protein